MDSTHRTKPAQPQGEVSSVTTAEIVERLSHFDGPPQQFLVTLLSVQCRLAAAEGGAILRVGGERGAELLAVYPQLPEGSTAPVWLAQAVESSGSVISRGTTAIAPIRDTEEMYGQPATRNLIMVPILGERSVRGLAAYLVNSADATVLAHCRERLELSISLLSLYEMRLTLQRRQFDLRRLQMAMETLSAVNEHNRFKGAGMAACNEIASRWGCERVSLGFLKGRYVYLKGLSHTEKINRKMKLIQDIESAMEECLDQDVEVIHPAAEDATYVARSTAELSKNHGPMSILSLPLRRAGDVVGVLTVERDPDRPFDIEEIESLRLTCELSTPRLAGLHETDRWFGARMGRGLRKGIGHVIGPKHTWIKLGVLAAMSLVLFALFVEGDYDADATFVLEAVRKQIIPAPFEGYIEEVHVEPGDKVIAHQTVLAKLETTDLESKLIERRTEYAAALSERAKALDEDKIADAQIARSNAQKALAQINLLERKIREASIRSPIDGTIVSPDLSRRIRGHVDIGDGMFEVAPVESLRAELSVPEDQIIDVFLVFEAARKEGKELLGELATEGKPGTRIEFAVERINPVAEVVENKNVFKVRAQLHARPYHMVPGMKGVAKVRIGRRTYAYMWTRKLINWVRMKLWL